MALYEALNAVVGAQTTVLNGGQVTSLKLYLNVLAELNDFLTANTRSLNLLLAGNTNTTTPNSKSSK